MAKEPTLEFLRSQAGFGDFITWNHCMNQIFRMDANNSNLHVKLRSTCHSNKYCTSYNIFFNFNVKSEQLAENIFYCHCKQHLILLFQKY